MQKINLIAQSVLELSHRENSDEDDDDNDTHQGWIIVRDGMYSVADKNQVNVNCLPRRRSLFSSSRTDCLSKAIFVRHVPTSSKVGPALTRTFQQNHRQRIGGSLLLMLLLLLLMMFQLHHVSYAIVLTQLPTKNCLSLSLQLHRVFYSHHLPTSKCWRRIYKRRC